ncbi:MAG: bifunctional alpha,alpha-trehalose-phosphate synthase (UDP-forming)/trehalose-phosphatase [Chitinivibrionales bacterium]|nr:bifunctional alpha,alpha-trehalose-phosphate synthase (UDP-forming)/trehalose-phosphatase [Chitinivibrionales bacterium]
MARIIIVSNRLPVTIKKSPDGFTYSRSIGGLATAMQSVHQSEGSLWVGWCGMVNEELDTNDREKLTDILRHDYKCIPLFLSQRQIEVFYNSFSNKTVWPLFHYFPLLSEYDEEYWDGYWEVNEIFMHTLEPVIRDTDIIWIQDYHLMLLPGMIRKNFPAAKIGFFLHIPFPSFEIFRLLPWRKELLQGILGADLIGFHTYDYVRHFLSSVRRLLFLDVSLSSITTDHRDAKADAFPLGVDFDRYRRSGDDSDVQKNIGLFRKKLAQTRIILSVDRLDYTKGIPSRLHAYQLFLEQYPQYKEKITLILIAAPSRIQVHTYQEIKQQIEQLVSLINGKHGTVGWTPVQYFFRSFGYLELTALYHCADILLVTPLRDGMNLVAKEYMAARQDHRGIAVISETTGAASEFNEALVVNPNNTREIADALHRALSMPPEERRRRAGAVNHRLERYDVKRWAGEFLQKLDHVIDHRQRMWMNKIDDTDLQLLSQRYHDAQDRLFILDYNGTLVEFSDQPLPDEGLYKLLDELVRDTGNDVVIVSGSNRRSMDDWFGSLEVHLVAEQGAWIRRKGKAWAPLVTHQNNDWKDAVRPLLEIQTDRTPGSFITERYHALLWQYDRCTPELANVRIAELRESLLGVDEHLSVRVYEDTRTVELQESAISKARAVSRWLSRSSYDFILAAGNDLSDEDIFATLPGNAFSIRVGHGHTDANYVIQSPHETRHMLQEIIKQS